MAIILGVVFVWFALTFEAARCQKLGGRTTWWGGCEVVNKKGETQWIRP